MALLSCIGWYWLIYNHYWLLSRLTMNITAFGTCQWQNTFLIISKDGYFIGISEFMPFPWAFAQYKHIQLWNQFTDSIFCALDHSTPRYKKKQNVKTKITDRIHYCNLDSHVRNQFSYANVFISNISSRFEFACNLTYMWSLKFLTVT